MPKPKAQTLHKTCERCGTGFTVPNKVNYREKRFCTRACSNAATAEKRAATLRGKQGYRPPICPCGKEVTAKRKYVYAKDKKYCSPECRAKYGKKRQADPANYVTFACQNCGEETIRRKGLGYHKYCSNECAAKHTKIKKHIVVDDAIVLDSSYEALFWGLCCVLKIPIERYDRSQAVEWSPGHWYAPDFWLPTVGTAVELKGYHGREDAEKWCAFRNERGPLCVMMHKNVIGMASGKAEMIELITALAHDVNNMAVEAAR